MRRRSGSSPWAESRRKPRARRRWSRPAPPSCAWWDSPPPLRRGVPSAWIEELCPDVPAAEPALRRLSRDCALALDAFSRLWFATSVSLTGFAALAAVLTARCAGIVALWEELGGGAASR